MKLFFKSYFIIFLCAFLFLLIALYYFYPSGKDEVYIASIITASLFIFLLFAIYFRLCRLSWASFHFLFLVSFFIVYFQVSILEVFFDVKFMSFAYEYFWGSDEVANKVLTLSAIGLVAYVLGSVLSLSILMRSTEGRGVKVPKIEYDTSSPFFIIILSYFFYILFLTTSGSYAQGVYAAADQHGLNSYFLKMFDACAFAAVILCLSKITFYDKLSFYEYIKFFPASLRFIVAFHVVFSFYVGDRGPVMSYGLLFFSVYLLRCFRPRLFILLSIIILASSLMTAVGEIRGVGSAGEEGFIRNLKNAVLDKEASTRWYDHRVIGHSTSELSKSQITINYSVLNVPDNYNHTYGGFLMQNMVSIFPGMSSIYNSLVYNNEYKYRGSSTFVTYLVQGENPTYGNGRSILAELYLDFGMFGVMVGMLLFGFFISKGCARMEAGQAASTHLGWISILVYYSYSIYIVRSSISFFFGSIILIWIILNINNYVSKVFSKNKLTPVSC